MAVYEMSALALGRAIHERRISAPEALTELLRRLHQTEDAIHAYLTLDVEGAMHRAKLVQERIDRGETNSSLAGVPIALKDNICVNGMKTTCASRMLADFIPPYSATAVEKLLENDMVLYGKLNMDEFAMDRPPKPLISVLPSILGERIAFREAPRAERPPQWLSALRFAHLALIRVEAFVSLPHIAV